ncbi:hypothetical protein, partial [Halomonas sp. SpR8]|uniref:hypothetical protein n=1 Tax=Halomonas sp. SpR8 TaxID=3050463 RepID=UPI0027E4A2FE
RVQGCLSEPSQNRWESAKQLLAAIFLKVSQGACVLLMAEPSGLISLGLDHEGTLFFPTIYGV